jgi:hypothetical protein
MLFLRKKDSQAKNSRYKQILFWLITLIIFVNVLCPLGQRATAVCFVHLTIHKINQPFLFCPSKIFPSKISKIKIK